MLALEAMTAKTKIVYEDVKPLVEALKEGARVVLIAVIPLLIGGLDQGSINWNSIAVVAAITALRMVDKYLHLEGKETGNNQLTRGLVQF